MENKTKNPLAGNKEPPLNNPLKGKDNLKTNKPYLKARRKLRYDMFRR